MDRTFKDERAQKWTAPSKTRGPRNGPQLVQDHPEDKAQRANWPRSRLQQGPAAKRPKRVPLKQPASSILPQQPHLRRTPQWRTKPSRRTPQWRTTALRRTPLGRKTLATRSPRRPKKKHQKQRGQNPTLCFLHCFYAPSFLIIGFPKNMPNRKEFERTNR